MKKGMLSTLIAAVFLLTGIPVGAAEKEERKLQDETVYLLMVDRFNNGDFSNNFEVNTKDPTAFQGGDFQGIIDQLDYIKDMGFTSILLTPIFDNSSMGYHGYWVTDYYKTEEHFGSIETFKQLVEEAHNRDIKIILDFVANSVSPEHEWVNDPAKEDWFHEDSLSANQGDQEQLEGLPDLNHDNPEVRDYLMEAAKWWISETNIDGYRLDSVNHVPADFWTEFTHEVKSMKEDFYLLGEVPSNEPAEIAQYNQTEIDGFLNYPLMEPLRTAFAQPGQPLDMLFSVSEQNESVYKDPYLMMSFMDNHDTVRFTRDAINNNQHPGARWKLALTYLYTTPGIPAVYYGSEIALDGGEAPENRRLMDFRTDKELVDHITKLGELRADLPSLTRGTMELLYEANGMAVYKRVYEDETTVIAINNTTETHSVTLTSEHLEGEMELRGLLANDLIRSNGEEYLLVLDREESEIYVLAERTGLNIPYLVVMGTVYAAFFGFIYLLWKRAKRKNSEENE
ncbi:alpha-amylase family glycosyl hydrolase [Mesobacillus harenae]|uniref:alpha-amylase family glycosyl hydrolase n=1 Tax=Mesobacillus harenae TaxID=2213203 RepID=UPI001580864A|nr:alpha-amylase family glycosyl hydrolase [Mesobacillus harenae]